MTVGIVLGVVAGVLIMLAALGFASPGTNPHKEATLPSICRPGEQIIMITAPQAELYSCEAHWVRK